MKNAILLTDGYKLDHRRQYPEGTEYVYSTWIPKNIKIVNVTSYFLNYGSD